MNSIPYFDGHCDTISLCEKEGRSLRENAGHLDLMRLKAYSGAAQFFAMYHDLADAPADGMFAECRRQQAVFAREMAKNADIVTQCRTAAEVKRANAEGKIAALLSCEGSELLNCDPANLDWAKKVGVKAINLESREPHCRFKSARAAAWAQRPRPCLRQEGAALRYSHGRLSLLRRGVLGSDGDHRSAHYCLPFQFPLHPPPHKEHHR